MQLEPEYRPFDLLDRHSGKRYHSARMNAAEVLNCVVFFLKHRQSGETCKSFLKLQIIVFPVTGDLIFF